MEYDSTSELSSSFRQYIEDNLPVLDSDTRKHALSYLMENEDVAVDKLAEEATEDLDMSEDDIRIRLHHTDLPRLEDEGLVQYERDEMYVELSEEGREVAGWMKEFGLM